MANDEIFSCHDVTIECDYKYGCDFVLIGSTGFIGEKMKAAIESAGYDVSDVEDIRLQQRAELSRFITENNPHHGVICCAGTRGKPNIDWCDEHQVETIDDNVIGQLNVATICHKLKLHCALIGSGVVYAGSPDKVYSEEDKPDNELQKTYVQLRIALEDMLKYYPNVLNLRVLYPITRNTSDQRGLIGKLAKFTEIDDVSTCCTFLEDLCPLVPHLMKKKVSGNLNFVNPGLVSYREIVKHLQSINPNHNPTFRTEVARPAIHLDTKRLLSECADFKIRTAEESLAYIFSAEAQEESRLAKQREKSHCTFTVTLEKLVDDTSLGIGLRKGQKEVVIKKPAGRALTVWHDRNPTKLVRDGDRIVSVNGKRSVDQIIDTLRTPQIMVLNIKLRRQTMFVVMCKKAEQLGMEIDPDTLVVKTCVENKKTPIYTIQDWNSKCDPSVEVLPGDCLTEVNGKTINLLEQLDGIEVGDMVKLIFTRPAVT